jgi:hypothetical protein
MPAKTKSTRKAKATKGAKAAQHATPAPSAKATTAAKETAPQPVGAARAVRRSAAELHFTEATITRGEAVEPDEALPSGATHEIAGHDASGQPILKRKRFSIC